MGQQTALSRCKHLLPRTVLLLRHPVLRGAVLGGQHHLARLQAHALAGFQTFEDALGLFTPVGDDLGQLFEQGFGHEYDKQARPRQHLIQSKVQ